MRPWIHLTSLLLLATDLLAGETLREHLALLGDDVVLKEIEAPVINDIGEWIRLIPGEYTYRFTMGEDGGKSEQVERHIPLQTSPDNEWERHIGAHLIERMRRHENGNLLIESETDHQYGLRIDISPPVHWPASLVPGQTWVVDSLLTVFDLDKNKQTYSGKMHATHKYVGAWRIHTDAGDFDAILLHEDFVVHIGPLKGEDDRYYFLAKGIGMVAEVEGIRASALLLINKHEDTAKVLTSYPH